MDRDAAPYFYPRGAMNRPRAAQAPDSAHASDRARRRRIAAARTARSSKVLVCEPEDGAAVGMCDAISALGYETVHCQALDDCLRAVTKLTPDAAVVVLADTSETRMSLLQLFRRAIPATPLVLVAPGASLEARARCHELRPYYFAVPPLPMDELRAVMNGAVSSQAPRA